MKFLVVLAFSLCALQLSWAEIRTAGRVIRGRVAIGGISLRDPVGPDVVCNAANKVGKSYCNSEETPACEADAVVTCTSSTSGFPVPCPTEKPYCVSTTQGSAKCSPTPPEGCPAVEPKFVCTNNGNYPDPFNCKIYYNCYKEDDEIKAETILCPPGYVFDPNSESKEFCLYTSVPSKCVTASDCKAKPYQNIILPFYKNKQYVAMCLEKSEQPLIFHCPTGTKANLNVFPVTCTFICKAEGQFAYTPDNKRYYDCKYDAARKLYSTLRDCPIGRVFNGKICAAP